MKTTQNAVRFLKIRHDKVVKQSLFRSLFEDNPQMVSWNVACFARCFNFLSRPPNLIKIWAFANSKRVKNLKVDLFEPFFFSIQELSGVTVVVESDKSITFTKANHHTEFGWNPIKNSQSVFCKPLPPKGLLNTDWLGKTIVLFLVAVHHPIKSHIKFKSTLYSNRCAQ